MLCSRTSAESTALAFVLAPSISHNRQLLTLHLMLATASINNKICDHKSAQQIVCSQYSWWLAS